MTEAQARTGVGSDCLEMAQARERPRYEPHAAQASDEEAVAAALRTSLLLPFDDLLAVVR